MESIFTPWMSGKNHQKSIMRSVPSLGQSSKGFISPHITFSFFSPHLIPSHSIPSYPCIRRGARFPGPGVEVVIGTPGRLCVLASSDALPLARVSMVIVDETDRLAEKGYTDHVNQILRCLRPDRQILIFAGLVCLAGNINEDLYPPNRKKE